MTSERIRSTTPTPPAALGDLVQEDVGIPRRIRNERSRPSVLYEWVSSQRSPRITSATATSSRST